MGKRRKQIAEVNLLGHCAFCLNNIVKGERDSDNVVSGYNEDVQEQLVEISELEGSKLTTVADFAPSSNILSFGHLWPYILEEGKINTISEMVFICKDGCEGDDDTVSKGKIPPMCKTCQGILEQLDKLHWGVLKTVEEMKKIIERTHESESGPIRGFLNLLKNFNEDTSTANSTVTFLEQLGDGRKYSLSHSNGYDNDYRRRRKRQSRDWKLNAEVIVPVTRLRRGRSRLTTPNSTKEALDSTSSNYDDVPVKTEILENDVDSNWADDDHAAELIQDDETFHDSEIKEELQETVSTQRKTNGRKPRKRKKCVYSTKKKTPIIRTKPLVQGCTRRCEVCGEVVNFQDLLAHMEAHVGDFVVKCPNPKCMFICSNPRTINKVHFKLVDRIPECTDLAKDFNSKNCEICGKKPTSIVNGRYHAKYHEKTELAKTISCPLPNCEERFALRASVHEHIFEKHISSAHRLPCSLCSRVVKAEISESHLRNDHGVQNPLKCQHRQCSHWLPSWEAIVDHMTSTHRHEDLICFICTDGTKFSRVREFRIHYLTAHKIGKEFICEHCGKGFTLELHLNVHVETVHPDHATTSIRKPIADIVMCDLCDESDINYRSEKRLIAHKIIVHGHTPFVCGICQKKFHSENSRQRHEINSHGSQFGFKDKEAYKCELDNCNKVLDKPGRLRLHQLRHHPEHFTEEETAPKFPCEHCEKKYYVKATLKIHMESEHLNITYMCDICGLKCRRKEGLRIHKRVHTGERPYACSQCDRAYFERRPLLVHMKTHHPQLTAKPKESTTE